MGKYYKGEIETKNKDKNNYQITPVQVKLVTFAILHIQSGNEEGQGVSRAIIIDNKPKITGNEVQTHRTLIEKKMDLPINHFSNYNLNPKSS